MLEQILKVLTEIRDGIARLQVPALPNPVPTPVPTPAAAPAPSAAVPTAPVLGAAAEKATRGMVGEKLVALSTKNLEKAQGVLREFGVEKLGDLSEDKYTAIYNRTVVEIAAL